MVSCGVSCLVRGCACYLLRRSVDGNFVNNNINDRPLFIVGTNDLYYLFDAHDESSSSVMPPFPPTSSVSCRARSVLSTSTKSLSTTSFRDLPSRSFSSSAPAPDSTTTTGRSGPSTGTTAQPSLPGHSKISASGAPDALFLECLSKIRETRVNCENHATQLLLHSGREEVRKLSNDEVHLVRKVFDRVHSSPEYSNPGHEVFHPHPHPEQALANGDELAPHRSPYAANVLPRTTDRVLGQESSSTAASQAGIDPYWDPFFETEKEKERVDTEFTEYREYEDLVS